MIKSFFKIFGALIAIILLAITIFYFYGSSASLAIEERHQVINNEKSETPTDTIKVITYNMGYLSGMSNNLPVHTDREFYKENEDSLIQFIRRAEPDIMAIQEIDYDSERSYKVDQLGLITDGSSLKNSARAVNWDKKYVPFPYWPVSSHFGSILSGQAVVSKYEMMSNDPVKLAERRDAPFYYKAFYLDRLMQVVKIKIGVQEVYLLNVHLEAFDAATRMEQIETVRQKFNELSEDYPVLLLGDFNAITNDPQDDTISNLMECPHIRRAISNETNQDNNTTYFTYSSGSPQRKIDYIFYNDNKIIMHDAQVLQDAGQISDHIPVMMRFSLI